MRIKAFKALRPPTELSSVVASVPYDVVNTEEARRLAAGNYHSFLHISRAEIDLPAGTDLYSDAVYAQAAATFAKFQKDGTLSRDAQPSLYVYLQQMGKHLQRGIVACCHVEDYENNLIRQHEKTLPAKENDRARHIRDLNAQAGPVFIVFRDNSHIHGIVTETEKTRALFDFTADDGVRHSAWRIADSHGMESAFASVPRCYIADGHHRFAAAVKIGNERRKANPNHTGNEEYNWVLAVLFPASQLQILPYNRIVLNLNYMQTSEFLDKVRGVFPLREVDHGVPAGQGLVHMYVSHKWYELKLTSPQRPDAPKLLDVSVLQNSLLAPVLGIDDPRTNKRIEFVGGLRSVPELVHRVDSGRYAVAFSMCPVAIDDVMAYSDASLIMPPKSTWFEPKLRSGLFVHTL